MCSLQVERHDGAGVRVGHARSACQTERIKIKGMDVAVTVRHAIMIYEDKHAMLTSPSVLNARHKKQMKVKYYFIGERFSFFFR